MKMEMFYSCIQNLYNLHCYEIIYHSNIGILATKILSSKFSTNFCICSQNFCSGWGKFTSKFSQLKLFKIKKKNNNAKQLAQIEIGT